MFPSSAPSIIEALLCLLLAAPASAAGRDAFADGSGRRGPELADVPGGEYLLGSAPGEPAYMPHDRRRRVELSPFALTAYEITNDEFAEFLNERGGKDEGGLPWVPGSKVFLEKKGKFTVARGQGRRPVVSVSWAGARAYAHWLSGKTGRRYELPTAAQWEAGARGGTSTTWWWGDVLENGRAVTGAAVVDVGTLPPNAYGLYDTAGNAWEWTQDCLHYDSHKFAPRRDPSFFDESCGAPEVRGGSFRDGPEAFRSGRRLNYWNYAANDSVGFRLAREPRAAAAVAPPARKQAEAAGSAAGLEVVLDMPRTETTLSFILFVEGRDPVYGSGGDTLRLPLPPGETVTFEVLESDLGERVRRETTIEPGRPTVVRLTGKDFKLPGPGRKTLSGVVKRADGVPVRGAVVVLGSYPDRRETRTDAKGRYRFERVREGIFPLLVDARGTSLPGAFVPVRLLRDRLEGLERVTLPLSGGASFALGSDIVENAVAAYNHTTGRWERISDVGPGYLRNHLKMTLPADGEYTIFWAKLPLFVCFGGGALAAGYRDVAMDCNEEARTIELGVYDHKGSPADVAVYISSFAEDPDPYEVDTPGRYVSVPNVNTTPFNAWVDDDEAGCYDGEVNVDPETLRATLHLAPPGSCD